MNIDPSVQSAIWGAVGVIVTALAKPAFRYFSGKAEREARQEIEKEHIRQQEMKDLRRLLEDSKNSCNEKIGNLERYYRGEMDKLERRSSEEINVLREQNTSFRIQIGKLETRLELTEKFEKAAKENKKSTK